MDDPWAAPSWSTPAKPSSSSPPKRLSMTPPRSPTALDVSDPWGAPPTSAMASMTMDERSAPLSMKAPETPGWGHDPSWGAGDVPAPRAASPSSPIRAVTRLSPSKDDSSWGGAMDLPSSSPPPRLSFDAAPPTDPFQVASTPPQSFSALPNLSSPHTPHSTFSPHSHRSMTPTITHQPTEEDDPEAAFAAALPQTFTASDLPTFDIPKSPSFGEGDFGGFSSGLGDPWGAGEKTGWGGDERPEEEGRSKDNDEDEDVGEGWGRVRSPPAEAVRNTGREEEDWEAAQRKIQLAESLVPHDKVDRLKKVWSQVAEAMIGLNKLPSPTASEVQVLESALRRLENDRDETLRSLASIPSDINTYPPILSSFTTHTTYLSSLSRPHPSPATSFLIPNNKRPRRTETTAEQSKDTAWLSRSRLGEPEIVAGEKAPAEQESKTRWGFWGRRPAVERTLTTSGGGVLEVKAATGSTELRKSTSQQSLSVPPSRISTSSANTSRPVSVFEAPGDILPVIPPSNLMTTSPTSATSQPSAPPQPSATSAPMAQGPSAVSRFFGRWRQPSSSGPTQSDPSEDNAKDLELGEEDFSYLGQVPSFAPPPPDLLDTHQKKTHEMASLESMIQSKPTPLPAPLAPPPLYSRSNSASGPVRNGVKRNDMDLLSGLYDGDDMGTASVGVEGKKGNDPIGWDDFLGPTPSGNTVPTPVRPPIPSHQSTSSDFGDFDAPSTIPSDLNQSSSGFDDFGDFSTFESPPPPPPPVPSQRIPFLFTPSQPAAPPPISYKSPLPTIPQTKTPQPSFSAHRNRPSLDHTPALNLVNDASTTKGKRWPAPLSPDMPIIAPPSPGFPFLSPPPAPPRAGSRMSDMMNDDSAVAGLGNQEGMMGIQQGLMSPVSVKPAQAPAVTSRSQTPVMVENGQGGGKEKGGLSAHDLSFFDNL